MTYRTLIIDDEIFMCRALRKVIEDHCPDFSVVDEAYNGSTGLKLVQENHYDVILTDIRMPVMSGLEFLNEIRDMGMEMPVIIITGHSEFNYTRTAIRLRATDYILKPLNVEEIKSVLNYLSERMRNLSFTKAKHELQGINNGHALIESMLDYMKHYYMRDLSIAFFSEKTGYNPSYISRLFKLQTGKGFIQHLIEVRMEHAKQMLVHTDLQVSEIGEKVGYVDSNHFGKVFKKEVGSSPGVYREKIRSGVSL